MLVAICDDDPVWNKTATGILKDFFSQQEETADILCFETGNQLLSHKGDPVDVLLMDIRLEEENGIDLVSKINVLWENCQIVYCTDYLYYATDVYETRHTYFVVKNQFEKRLPKVFDQIRAYERQSKAEEVYFHAIGKGVQCFVLSDILYFERKVRDTIVYTKTGGVRIREKIVQIMELVPSYSYTRCHNSYLVMLDKISRRDGQSFILKNGATVPISRGYIKTTKDDFLKWCERHMK